VAGRLSLRAPEPLDASHDLAGFDSGVSVLDDWLKRRALRNQEGGATRTFVVCEGRTVIAYHALASGGVMAEQATGRFRRNMPDPVPVAILARLAVDRSWQKRGIGRGLFQDAALRVLNASSAIGIRGMLVHAISDEARAFYISLGFDPSPLDPMTLMVTLADLRHAVATDDNAQGTP
jgi:GNAT superfamily N-acetyltransferase